MSRYAHPDVLDNGPAYIKANCNKVILLSAYTNVYATANTTNKIAEAALVTTDFTLTGADGSPRVLTAALNGKSAGNALLASDAVGAPNRHVAFVDTVNSKVLLVEPDNSGAAGAGQVTIALGQAVTFNSNPTYTANQPTA